MVGGGWWVVGGGMGGGGWAAVAMLPALLLPSLLLRLHQCSAHLLEPTVGRNVLVGAGVGDPPACAYEGA